jgi:glycosyltransferase involved in cell wall biosynthesis
VRRSILHVAAPTNGGVPRYVENLALDQADRGFDVTVATPSGSELTARLYGSDVRVVPWKARREPGATVVTEAIRLGRIVREVEPDLVHLHAAKAGLAGRLALRGSLPTIFQPHAWSFEAATGAVYDAALAWERFAARWTDVILCVSQAERFRGEEAGIDAPWRVVRNGVDLTAFREASDEDRNDARARLHLNGAPLVICVGRLCRQKGQDVLLSAWPEVVERVPDAELVLVGDGPDERRLRRIARSSVQLVGARDDVCDWMTAADVFVAPSRWEGMSLAMLEAMACGRSIVATDVPGAREAIDGNGAVVPVESPEAIAQALLERLLDPEKATTEGNEARRRAETFHDSRRMADAVAHVYADVLRRRTAEAAIADAEQVAAPVG